METACWSLWLRTDGPTVAYETGLEEMLAAGAISTMRDEEGVFLVEAFFEEEPDAEFAEQILRSASEGALPEWGITYHDKRDWLAENRADFPPLQIGPFWVHGSHIDTPPPAGCHSLLVDAALAFGSGSHPTTMGCLMALVQLTASRPKPARILDMGCGSAILAMAAHRLHRGARLLAADNDPASVRTAAENFRRNQIAPAQAETVLSEGFAHRRIRKAAPYNLIFANILAGPLRAMAGDISAHLADGGRVILSGLMTHQAKSVLTRYRRWGLVPESQLHIGEWTTLVLKPAGHKAP